MEKTTSILSHLVQDVIKLIFDPLDHALLAMTCKTEQAARPPIPENIGQRVKHYLAIQAVRRGHLQLAEWWLTEPYEQQRYPLQAYEDERHGYKILMVAAEGGHADLVRFIHEHHIMGENDAIERLGTLYMENPVAIPVPVWLELKIMGIRLVRDENPTLGNVEQRAIHLHLLPTYGAFQLFVLLNLAIITDDLDMADEIWRYEPGCPIELVATLSTDVLRVWSAHLSIANHQGVTWTSRVLRIERSLQELQVNPGNYSNIELDGDCLLFVPEKLPSNDEGQVLFFWQWLRRRARRFPGEFGRRITVKTIRSFCGRHDMNLWLVRNTALDRGWLTPIPGSEDIFVVNLEEKKE